MPNSQTIRNCCSEEAIEKIGLPDLPARSDFFIRMIITPIQKDTLNPDSLFMSSDWKEALPVSAPLHVCNQALEDNRYKTIASKLISRYPDTEENQALYEALIGIFKTGSLKSAFFMAPELLPEFDYLCRKCPAKLSGDCLPIATDAKAPTKGYFGYNFFTVNIVCDV